jgi:hypothetical protein
MWHEGEDIYQFGRTSNPEGRVKNHRGRGFVLLDLRWFGDETADVENRLAAWLPPEWRVPNRRERWYGEFARPTSLSDLFRIAGI